MTDAYDDYDYDDYDYGDYSDEENTTVRFVQCYCEGHCPFGDDKGICEISTPGGKCFKAIALEFEDDGEEYTRMSYGCIEDGQMAILQCKGALVHHLNKKNIHCCDDGDFCNTDSYSVQQISEEKFPVLILTSSIVSVLVVMLILFVTYLKFRRKNTDLAAKVEENKNFENNNLENECQKTVLSGLPSILDPSSGSGSGFPIMVQRTIAKQIDMEKVIGKGRYGEVWLAKWRGEKVAAKIFLSTQEKSWFRETEVYRTILMRHENILGFIAADIKGTCGWTQLLLITEYHENGSLFDYLQTHSLNINLLLSMSMGISKGISHLHTEIFGVPGKPPIAHRDLKSKNILIKRNLDCCIADFGLAVRYNGMTKTVDVPLTDRSGTKRYMAPEILSKTINLDDFDSHKMADMYAFGLVLWEMSRRCVIGEHGALTYEIPFFGFVSTDPDFEEMQTVVCVKKIRPVIPEFWEENNTMQIMSKIIQEMWHDNPTVRLTPLRVKKTLHKLILKNNLASIANCSEIE